MTPAGQNMHLLLSLLIKHIENKAMLKQPDMQLSIVEVAATLAELSSAQASAATIGAISDLVRHLKRTFHITLGSKDAELVKSNEKFRKAIDECLVQLSKKVCFLFCQPEIFCLYHLCKCEILADALSSLIRAILWLASTKDLSKMHEWLIKTILVIRYLMLGQFWT